MKLKYKRSDLGLYVALGLVGVGLGVLGGALWASRRKKEEPVEERFDDEPIGRVTSVDKSSEGLYMRGEFTRPGLIRDGDSVSIAPFDTKFDVKIEEVDTGKKFPDEDFREERRQDDMSDELIIFIEEYDPTPATISMIHTGVLTIDEAKERMEIAEEAGEHLNEEGKRYSYDAPYRPTPPEKPDLDDLVPPEEVAEDPVELIDDRYEILPLWDDEGQSILHEVDKAFTYLEGNPLQWATLSARNHLIKETNIEKWVTNRAWGPIEDYLREHGFVYVFDRSTERIYSFELPLNDENGDAGVNSEDSESST